MTWLDVLRGPGYGNTLNGSSATYTDPNDGRKYRAVYSGGGVNEQGIQDSGVLVGYIGTDGKPWYQGQIGQVYDTSGNPTSQFVIDSPQASSFMDKLVMAFPLAMLAIAGAGAAGFGPAAAGAGSVGGTVDAAASLAPGESLVTSAGTSLSGVTGFGDAGTMYAGADAASAATLGGGASVAGGASLSAAAVSSVASASSSVTSMLSSAAGVATKVLGTVATIAGIKAKTVGAPQYVQPAGITPTTLQQGAGLAGLSQTEVLLLGAFGIAALVLSAKH